MLTEKARVIAIHSDTALVETRRHTACGGCAVNASCGTGVIARWWGDRPLRLEARNPVGARVGEEVVLGIEEGVVVSGSLLVYALPLVTMLGGGLLGEWLRLGGGGGEGLTIVLALLGFALGWLIVSRRLSRGRSMERLRPVILERGAGAADDPGR